MVKVLYLVSSGEHADYIPEAVFSTRELAKAAIARDHQIHVGSFSYNDDVEEIELDPGG